MSSSKVLRKEPCKRCREKGEDRNGDNFVVYEGGSGHCFKCGYTVLSEDYKLEYGLLEQIYEHEDEGGVLVFQEEWEKIKNKTRTEGNGFRGIRDDIYAKFAVRHEYQKVLLGGEETEELITQYYPLTANIEGNVQVCGVKVRGIPKKFRAEGLNKPTETQLFGQANFYNSLSKTICIASGEIDQLSVYQMLYDNLREQCPAVVSGTCGEGAVSQYQAQYEFFNKFEKIILIPDADAAGKAAMKKAVQALPKDKVYILEIPEIYKDPNAMLTSGKEKDFITLYYRAKPYVPDGIVGSGDLYTNLVESSKIERIPLPPFMSGLQNMLNGGFTLESINNIISASGQGKSTYVNEIIYHWIFNSSYKVGIVSMELSAGQYAQALFSRHVGIKLANMGQEELIEYLESDTAKAHSEELFKTETGSDRFFLIEDRSSKIDILQTLIQELIIGCGCKIIVIDPLQDMFSGLSLEQQENHMQWQKIMVKTYNVCIFNVNHTRKAPTTKDSGSMGGLISEEDTQGSSTIYKSASTNILLIRNKLAEDELERNRTTVYLSKNRVGGTTGPAGHIYYDNATHTLHDEESFKYLYPEKFIEHTSTDS